MHVLILSQYFFPELISTGQLLTELGEDLARCGCSVTVIAGQPTYYERTRVVKEIYHHGIRILRVGHTQWSKNSISGRIVNSATYVLGAMRKAFSLSHGSVVLVVSNPPFLPLLGYLLSVFRQQKYICLIHDVYPDIAVKLGYLRRGGVLEMVWEALNRSVMKKATALVVLGRDMAEVLQAKVRRAEWDKIRFIPNWSDGEEIVPLHKEENGFLIGLGIPTSTFLVQYSGNMGLFHDMETIVLAAELLQDLPVRFLLIGGGGKREMLERMVRRMELRNVTFLPYQPKERLRESLSCSDVSIVCLEKGVEGLAVPCKYYGILASGRPVIAMVDERSEIGLSVREAGCGFVIPQANAGELARTIRYLFEHPEEGRAMGEQARRWFEMHYTRRAISSRYLDLLREVHG